MRKYQVVLLALFAIALLTAPIAARADTTCSGSSLCVSVSDTVNPTQFFGDSGPGDSCGAAGCVQFSTTIGNWSLSNGTALGAPFFSLPALLDLSSIDVSNSGGGTLILLLTETNVNAPIGTLSALLTLGGTHSIGNATMTAQAFIGTTNVGFDTSTSLTSLIHGNGLSFNGQSGGSHATGTGPYSLTLEFILSDPAADHTSFDGDLNQVPEPATLSVLGAGLLALGTGLRRKLLKG